MIEILVVRDPDSANEIRVWVDGVETRDVHVVNVDAGAGWGYDDWRDAATDAVQSGSGEFCDAITAAYGDPPGREYIDGWPEED